MRKGRGRVLPREELAKWPYRATKRAVEPVEQLLLTLTTGTPVRPIS
jgi:hypothetical protein